MSNLLLIIDGSSLDVIHVLTHGLKFPGLVIKGLLTTINESVRLCGFKLKKISGEEMMIVFQAVENSADTYMILGAIEGSLPEAMLREKVRRIEELFSFTLGYGWARTKTSMLQKKIRGLTPLINLYLTKESNSLDFCLGCPREIPAKHRQVMFRSKTATLPTLAAAFHEDALVYMSDDWQKVIEPQDAFCMQNYLSLFPGDTLREVPCFLDAQRSMHLDLKDSPIAFMQEAKRIKRLISLRVFPDLRLVFLLNDEDKQTMYELAELVHKAFLQDITSLLTVAREFEAKLVKDLNLTSNILAFRFFSDERGTFSTYEPEVKHLSTTDKKHPASENGTRRRLESRAMQSLRTFANIAGEEFFGKDEDSTDRCLDFCMKNNELIFYACADSKDSLFVALPVGIPLGTEGKIARALLARIKKAFRIRL
mmetsp:Transcript_5109/g.9737  ORF Transcript_5109/g.9737 Transcript_5109/m.9737 type:complete len:425 (-) Transcript_5109:92-1366(-)